MESKNLDHQACYLVQAAQSELRKHLGVRHLGLDFVVDLYVHIKDVLRGHCDLSGTGPRDRKQVVEELALQMYVVAAAAAESGTTVGPELLAALQRVLSGAAYDLGGFTTTGGPDFSTKGE